MIYPSLFIGLGTTGVDILVELQQLVLEHYGQPSLPIFAYVALETDRAKRVWMPSWASNEIHLIHTTIPNADAIGDALNRGEKEYLKEWLNPNLVGRPGGEFVSNIGHVRMAGRLCLWENWEAVVRQLFHARSQITAHPNIVATDRFLRRRYTEIGKVIPSEGQLVGTLPNIYIVGTLCGGTCSGMFMDLGYYVKHVFGLWAQNLVNIRIPKVIGVFTVYDSASLNNAQQERQRKLAANCWAALLEYDYWCHPESRYHVTFPDGMEVGPTNEKPIDWLYLLSCSGEDAIPLRKPDGSPDLDALNHMAAMTLFTETVEDLFGKKEWIRVECRASHRATRTSPNEHTPCIATCGIATVQYPKYRIAEGAACRYGVRLCQEWKGGELDTNSREHLEKGATAEWQAILAQKRPTLTTTADGPLDAQIRDEYHRARPRLLELDSQAMKASLREKMNDDLKENGRFDASVSERGRQTAFRSGIVDDIEAKLVETLNQTENLAQAQQLLAGFDHAVASTIGGMPAAYPAPDWGWVDNQDLDTDVWSESVFRGKAVSAQLKRELIDDCQAYEISQLEKIVAFRMRQPLLEVRRHLGVEMQLAENQVMTGVRTIKQKLDTLERCLNTCIGVFNQRANDMANNINITQDVMIITQRNNVQEDINLLYARLETLSPDEKQHIKSEIMTDPFTNVQRPLDRFLGYGVLDFSTAQAVETPIRRVMLREALSRIESFVIAEELQQQRDIGSIRLFVNHAQPHLELTGDLAHYFPVEFIIGKDRDETMPQIRDLADRLNAPVATDRIRFVNLMHEPELDHMLIFYKEEGLIFMDENLATSALFEQRYREATQDDVYGLHTHRSRRSFFDIWIAIRRKEAEDIMKPLVEEIVSTPDSENEGKWESSEIFEVVGERLVLRNIPGSMLVLTPENMVENLAQDKRVFDYLKEKLTAKLQEIGRSGFDERLSEHLDRVENAVINGHLDPIEVRNQEREKYSGPEGIIKRLEDREYVPQGFFA